MTNSTICPALPKKGAAMNLEHARQDLPARLATRLALPGDLATTPPAAQETLAAVPDWRAASLFASPRHTGRADQPTPGVTADALPAGLRNRLYPNATGSQP
ncbi:hypothetical protein J2792_002113 [Novosphingobium capsulatum]|uniref:Uncharacterized protein n=1 Tax=Novosphingobium capsulatum TaxID=13688 RepID=A0ABU1MLQ3_9SPHN|nr:hypothetical protein [Novosphingobium capsulatum]MDR6511241.1 hypothetical protein [Novosphingobium capsulatum]